MARTYGDRRSWAWEYQGVRETPFAHYGKERPLVAMFKHVARNGSGDEIAGLQCTYPNERGLYLDELKDIVSTPYGHYRHGISLERIEQATAELTRAIRLSDAVKTFTAASDEEIEALMPKPTLVVVVNSNKAQDYALKIA